MQFPAHYQADILLFFQRMPALLPLYQALIERLDTLPADTAIQVQKTQITFVSRYVYGCVSLPVRRKKDWPEQFLLVTFGLPVRLDSPRIAAAVQPYPNRWTHHVLVTTPDDLDAELLDWLRQAQAFALVK